MLSAKVAEDYSPTLQEDEARQAWTCMKKWACWQIPGQFQFGGEGILAMEILQPFITSPRILIA